MRDPSRINKLLNELEELWNIVPDWRFGQLIINLLSYIGRDPFYFEDDKMEDIIKNYKEELARE